ncbi:MAG TPA: asparagine synthase (glutamine-hydrolyzing), partial [Bryobacteraceae bacterium]|nr:asparagine synthase (glutamine-hydrolyzing) [Bryobacteraceae bacterium]
AFLGHRRLSIIDLAAGQQPMTQEAGDLILVYNGEIYNHADLRPDLERVGHHYHSRCDSETILHAFEQYGEACVERFRGMFSFALWDVRRRRLFCARDRLGIKPFYYFWNGELLAFASEMKALFEHPAISPSLEDSALPEYLAFGYGNTAQTLFRGVRKLLPGHSLSLSLSGEAGEGALDIRQYWEIPAPPEKPEVRDDRSWIEECGARLKEAVRMRLMSDVPLGMFLSGGADSSAIAALMKGMADGPVQTFAVGYRENEFSELEFAREAARSIGTEHHEITIGRDDFFGALPKLIWHEDEPIAWPSSVSLYFVSRLASRRVKVVLTGEGSDELFGGYSRYRHYLEAGRWARAWGAVPGPLRRLVSSRISSTPLLSATLRRKLEHTCLSREPTLESLYLDNFYGGFAPREMSALFSGAGGLNSRYAGFLDYWNRRSSAGPLARMLYADQKTYLAELLMKQDQMSMACSIESRVPFLDHPLVEFAARAPDRLKIRNGTGKYIFKEAVKDLVPPELLHRKKMGFPTPLRPWLLDPAAQPLLDSLLDPDGLLASFTDRAAMEALIGRHRAGREDATDRLWRLINLQLWGDLFLTGRRDRWLAAAGAMQ